MAEPPVLLRYRARVESALDAAAPREPAGLATMVRYHLGLADVEGRVVGGDPGKLLRSSLCCALAEAAGAAVEDALPFAVAVELVHAFSLVHDDIQDHDRRRRHRPTVWAVWGVGQAINAGDLLWALAQRTLLRSPLPAEVRAAAASELAEACMRMIEGQYLDLYFEAHGHVTPTEYLDMIGRKTGALLGAAAALGLLAARRGPEEADAAREFGRRLGVAFQVQDDYLGVWGEPDELGKPVAADIARRKKSYPVVFGLAHAQGSDREALERHYGGSGDVAAALAALESCGARAASQALVARATAEAETALDALPLRPEHRAAVRELVAFLATRTR